MLELPNLKHCMQHARLAALGAWNDVIAGYYRGTFAVHEKTAEGPATDADIEADAYLSHYLRRHYPAARWGLLTEEGAKGTERLERDLCWIVDPIDGTSDFIRGDADFAVQIGLAARLERGGHMVPVLGVVYQPVTGLLWMAARGHGAWREDLGRGEVQAIRVSSCEQLAGARLVVTKSNWSDALGRAVERLAAAEIYRKGSLGLKVCDVAQGTADLYLNTARRNCKEWDTCGPEAILREAGGTMTNVAGSTAEYNKPDVVHHGGVVASNGLLHPDTVERLVGLYNN
jgi:3'(2'), 5'-bisphosphate nucleotidase